MDATMSLVFFETCLRHFSVYVSIYDAAFIHVLQELNCLVLLQCLSRGRGRAAGAAEGHDTQ